MSVRALPGASHPSETAAATRRITTLAVGCALVLIAIKAVAWRASGSVALLSSLADSALDLVASLGAFFAVRYAAVPPDAEHRFGHGKAEAFASLMQAGLVFASAALVGRESVARLFDPQPVQHEGWAAAVLVVSLVLTGLLVAAQARVVRRTGSVAVSGDRAHYEADFLTNLAALVGVAAAGLFGEPRLDAAAGLFVAVWLVKGAIDVFREAADHLMDRELGDDARERILALAGEDPRITAVHSLRTRAAGPYVIAQMHAEMVGGLSLEEAHAVMIAMERRIHAEFPAADVLIHPDPPGRAEPHGGPFPPEAATR